MGERLGFLRPSWPSFCSCQTVLKYIYKMKIHRKFRRCESGGVYIPGNMTKILSKALRGIQVLFRVKLKPGYKKPFATKRQWMHSDVESIERK